MVRHRLTQAALLGTIFFFGSAPLVHQATAQPILTLSAAARSLASQIESEISNLLRQQQSSDAISRQLANNVLDEMRKGNVKPAEAVQAILDATQGASSSGFTAPILEALAARLESLGFDASVRSVVAATIVLAPDEVTDTVCATTYLNLCSSVRAELNLDEVDEEPTAAAPAAGPNDKPAIVNENGNRFQGVLNPEIVATVQ